MTLSSKPIVPAVVGLNVLLSHQLLAGIGAFVTRPLNKSPLQIERLHPPIGDTQRRVPKLVVSLPTTILDGSSSEGTDTGAVAPPVVVEANDNDEDATKGKLYVSRDLTYDGFGPLLPVAERVDELTGGWGLSYADLHPETPTTPAGFIFLATNACYGLAGLALGLRGDIVLGTLTEIAGGVSIWYHFSQLKFGQNRSEVKLALLTDYFTAGTALVTGGVYMVNMGIGNLPVEAIVVGALSIVCLTLCWVWEFGYPYLFWHSLWHILSAYSAYIVGQAHMGDNMGETVSGFVSSFAENAPSGFPGF